MRTAVFSIIGQSPLLMHSTKGMQDGGTNKVSAKNKPDPDVEAEQGTYRDADGNLYLPCIFFRQALVSAGKGRKIGKNFATTLLRGSVIDPDRRMPIINPETGEFVTDYEIDARPAVVGTSRIMRHRPRFENWACELPLDFDDEIFEDLSPVVQLMNIAGGRVGVGDYRVEKGGWFGRFECTEVAVLPEDVVVPASAMWSPEGIGV